MRNSSTCMQRMLFRVSFYLGIMLILDDDDEEEGDSASDEE